MTIYSEIIPARSLVELVSEENKIGLTLLEAHDIRVNETTKNRIGYTDTDEFFKVTFTTEQFCYWMQGFTELNPNTYPTPEQWKMIQEHLQTVFTKVTPPFGPGTTGPVKPIPTWPYPTPALPYDWTQPTVICSTEYKQSAIC